MGLTLIMCLEFCSDLTITGQLLDLTAHAEPEHTVSSFP